MTGAARHSRTRPEGGFTILEVLIALLLVAVGILGVGGLAVTNVRGNDAAGKLTEATILAQDRIEAVREAGYDGADALAGTEAYGAIAGHPAYRRVVAVADATPGTWMKTVTVTVQWEAGAHTVTLASIIAREWH
jgi:type IV pilus assembly protein PilV